MLQRCGLLSCGCLKNKRSVFDTTLITACVVTFETQRKSKFKIQREYCIYIGIIVMRVYLYAEYVQFAVFQANTGHSNTVVYLEYVVEDAK